MTDVIRVAEVIKSLTEELSEHEAGRTARTIVNDGNLRATLIVLADGAELGEHEAPPAATLQVLRGSITLRAGERSWPLDVGQLISIPHERHSVRADAESAILLTVTLS